MPGNEARLLAELNSWLGTPFWAQSGPNAKKGVGADCVSFVAAALHNVGALPKVHWPRYVTFGGSPNLLSMLHAIVVSQLTHRLRRVWTCHDWKPHLSRVGDIYILTNRKDSHHLAIDIGGTHVMHSLEGHGVCVGSIHDAAIAKKCWSVYRLLP